MFSFMKNLCRCKERIHPSPSGGGGSGEVKAVLRMLPPAILAMTEVMGAEDREVLAYLMTRSMSGTAAGEEQSKAAHGGAFDCLCFHCYTSFWSRWDCSAQRELIHQAIEAFEEHLESEGKDRGRTEKEVKIADAEVEEVGDGIFVEEEGGDDDWVDAAAELEAAAAAAEGGGGRT